MIRRSLLSAVAGLALASAAAAQTQAFLTEALINPTGTPNNSADEGYEFVEITGTPNATLTGWYFMVVEGDGSQAGVVDQLWDLSGYTIGSNGLLLIRDSLVNAILPAPPSGTSIVVEPALATTDIENGTNTYVLFRWDASAGGTLPNLGDDLDSDNDGVLDISLAGFVNVDAVAFKDTAAATDFEYAAAFGGTNLGFVLNAIGNGFTPDALYRALEPNNTPSVNGWLGGDADADLGNQGYPFTWDGVNQFGWTNFGVPDPSLRTLDGGILNDLGGQSCYADCDSSGTLNIFDYICFGNAYAAQQAYADCDGSGTFNIFDYICFGNAYAAGCP